MRLEVLLFGPEARVVGSDRAAVEVGAGATCAEVKARLAEAYPGLRGTLGAARVAVNSEFAEAERRIGPGDEVALIGLVSGG
jgi:molybdopterin converting factor small subunit